MRHSYKQRALHLIVKRGEKVRIGLTLTCRATTSGRSRAGKQPRTGLTPVIHLRSTPMNNLIWIDLNVAAGWLSSNPDEMMILIRDGTLGAKRRRHGNVVIRADDVRCLAEVWTARTPTKRRPQLRKTGTASSNRTSGRGARPV